VLHYRWLPASLGRASHHVRGTANWSAVATTTGIYSIYDVPHMHIIYICIHMHSVFCILAHLPSSSLTWMCMILSTKHHSWPTQHFGPAQWAPPGWTTYGSPLPPHLPMTTYVYKKNTPQGIKLAIPRAHGEGITSECFSHHGSLLAKTMVMNHRLRGCAAHLCVCQHKSQRICWPETSKLLTFWEWNMVMKSRNLFG
jgi:hypothetical protein